MKQLNSEIVREIFPETCHYELKMKEERNYCKIIHTDQTRSHAVSLYCDPCRLFSRLKCALNRVNLTASVRVIHELTGAEIFLSRVNCRLNRKQKRRKKA